MCDTLKRSFHFPFYFIFTDGGFLFPHSFFQHSVFQLHLACFVSQICPWFCPSGSLPIQHGDAHTPSKEWLSFKLFLSLFVTLCVCVLDFTPAPLLSPSDSPLCASLLFRHQEIPLRWTVDYRDSGAVGMGRRTIKEMTERLRAEEEKEENHSA